MEDYDAVLVKMISGQGPLPGSVDNMVFNFDQTTLPVSRSNGPGARSVNLLQKLPTPGPTQISCLDRLNKLQEQLLGLVASDTPRSTSPGAEVESHPSSEGAAAVPEEEALRATLSFLSIAQDLTVVMGSQASTPSTGESTRGGSDYWDIHGTISLKQSGLNPALQQLSTPAYQSAVLQTLTCYAYLLQFLAQVVTTQLAGQPREPPNMGEAAGHFTNVPAMSPATAFQLGTVSLASLPALNAETVLHTMLRTIERIHITIERLAGDRISPTNQENDPLQGLQTLPTPGPLQGEFDSPIGQTSGSGTLSSPVIMAAQAVMGVVYKKEALLVRKMRALANGR